MSIKKAQKGIKIFGLNLRKIKVAIRKQIEKNNENVGTFLVLRRKTGTENRTFTTLDMFPTTLAALGVEIEGDRLALGTDLFSERETLAEEYGLDVMNQELMRKSEFYNRKLMYGS